MVYLCAKKRIEMKNISVVLNIVLLIAVGFLYYLHFKQKTEAEPESKPVTVHLAGSSGAIAYVNTDTLLDQYDFYKDQKTKLESEQDAVKSQLKAQNEKWQAEVEAY